MSVEYNLYVDQGADFSQPYTVVDAHGNAINLTGATLKSQVKKSYTSTTSYDLTITVTDAVNGKITFSMANAETSTLAAGRYVYDAIMTISGTITRFVSGQVIVSPSVTS